MTIAGRISLAEATAASMAAPQWGDELSRRIGRIQCARSKWEQREREYRRMADEAAKEVAACREAEAALKEQRNRGDKP